MYRTFCIEMYRSFKIIELKLDVMCCAIFYHLYSFKKCEKHPWYGMNEFNNKNVKIVPNFAGTKKVK